MRRLEILAAVLSGMLPIASGGCASDGSLDRPAAIGPSPVVQAEARIVTPTEVRTESELAAEAERELMEQRWGAAATDYRLLVSADPTGPRASDYLFDLGLSLEGGQDRPGARDAFLELARRFPHGRSARTALVRAATLDAYLEDWLSLASIGDTILARDDIEDVDRLVALGARGLARIESADDGRAARDIYDGLELADRLHYGARDVLPVAVAQLRFALGELRRFRSERIALDPAPAEFLDRLDARCAGLLDAQAAYGEAVRSVDPHWASMAGFRVGEMYRTLHKALVEIPPPSTSKTQRQKDIFFAFMHVRYRVLLEKGLREMEQTIALGDRTNDSSRWVVRAREAKEEMQAALAVEEATLGRMPFTEAEIKMAMDLLRQKAAIRR
jgi:hypothetical protein